MLGSILAVIIGYIFGWLGGYVRQRAHDVVTSNAVTLVIPFGAYLAAESVHASGVIAVVIGAIQFTSTKYMAALEAEERLSSTSFWQIIELLMTGVAFYHLCRQVASSPPPTPPAPQASSLTVPWSHWSPFSCASSGSPSSGWQDARTPSMRAPRKLRRSYRHDLVRHAVS